MKRYLIILFFTLCFVVFRMLPCYAGDSDKQKIDSLLRQAKSMPRATCWELFFARSFIGVPYVAHTLEVGDCEKLVVNTRQLDCTTLVETVTALTLCAIQEVYTFQNYCDNLVLIRYRNGEMTDYTSRLHYFTDWIIDNTNLGIVEEIQSPTSIFKAIQILNIGYMSLHPTLYKHLKATPSFVPIIKQTEDALNGQTFRYIPKNIVNVDNAVMRDVIHDGDIIAITCNKAGLDIAHLGFAVWHKDGLHLLNASMLHKNVVDEPMTLYQYLSKHPSHTGIRVIRIKRP